MQIEVITIGAELLSGRVVDTNFAYIAKRLSEEGWTVFQHISIPDEKKRIEESVQQALKRSSIIFTTGGLGPTLDDCTKKVLAQLFGKTLQPSLAIRQDLVERFGQELASLEEQSTVPGETVLLRNKVGTAPGFLFEKDRKQVFVLPGVPLEMISMFEEEVLPKLRESMTQRKRTYIQTLQLCHLAENAIDPLLRELQTLYPSVMSGIYPSYGTLGVEFKKETYKEQEARRDLEACLEHVKKHYAAYIISTQGQSLAEVIQAWMVAHKKTLVLAESCTGGHLAAKLVDVPGASQYFLGSVVTYHNSIKTKALGVKKKTLESYGAVSKEVVHEMVQGALQLSGADYALAVSGIAGPSGGTEDKPVGTVWCALGVRGQEPYIGKILAKGRAKRSSVIEYTANFMLGALWRHIAYGIKVLFPK